MIREAGGDRSAVTGGTKVLSDWIVVKITSNPGETFLDRMIALVEGAVRQKTPNEIALNILLAVLTLVFLLVVVTLEPFAKYAGTSIPIPVLIALLVCLIPTTIGALISAIGIAGMDRLVQQNVLAMSGRAVEAAGDVDTLLLDKTGTITLGNRQATEFRPAPGVSEATLADAAQLASLADETPEGRSIVVLAKEKYGLRGRQLAAHEAMFVPFTAHTRMSGVDFNGRTIRKGAVDAIERLVQELRQHAAGGAAQPGRSHLARRRHAAGGRGKRPRTRRHPPQGHRERRHPRSVRAPACDGHQDRHDHRRQPAHRRGDRRRSRRRRLHGGSHAGREAHADSLGAGGRPDGRDDRRRHQRRAGAGSGGRGRGHEYRHDGRQGSRATWSTSTRTRPS